MKLLRYIVVTCCICTLFAGCSADHADPNKADTNHSTEDELYESGLELISVMNEMIQSDEYANIFLGPSNSVVESVLETVNTNDYDTPTAVYRITMSENTETLLNLSGAKQAMWDDLSDNLKKQLENRLSFSAIPTMINGAKGSEFLAFTSSYTAMDTNENISIDENTSFYMCSTRAHL